MQSPADTGASEKLDGSVKLKSGCSIKRLTANGLALDDRTELQADVVIFATGYVPCSTTEAKSP